MSPHRCTPTATPSRATATGTAPERFGAVARACACAALGCFASLAHADGQTSVGGIFSCTDASGKVLRSDRPIAECSTREQKVLGPDGSVRGVRAPTLSAEEQAVLEQRQRDDDAVRAARNEAVRRDRNLLQRYPDEAAHRKAREAALDEKRKSIAVSEKRLVTLAAERKPLEDERQFYPPPKPLPFKLKLAFDGNDAAVAGTKDALANQQADVVRINAVYDEELARLKKLWAGAPLGSAAPMVAAASAPPARNPSR